MTTTLPTVCPASTCASVGQGIRPLDHRTQPTLDDQREKLTGDVRLGGRRERLESRAWREREQPGAEHPSEGSENPATLARHQDDAAPGSDKAAKGTQRGAAHDVDDGVEGCRGQLGR